jgi:hypothetical protein
MRKSLIAAALVGSITISQALQAACWTPQAIAAAKVRTLDTMLMVSALRCRSSGHDFVDSYSSFVNQNRGTLLSAAAELQKHFGTPASYDHYVTSIANHYGAGVQGLSCENISTLAEMARNQGTSVDSLINVADQAGIEPEPDSASCATVAGR